ncbi:SH3 domain-containing protein [Vulcaniibacterium tengchongense]|uniref:NlpC/P60 family protein n=1 Tax=Vulcaniibacterium tengchongense TaxID=1273429 RepID=A0A3N4V265_9GAMM|nr:SH3 domain-containing protein [Vulcaniibacterium tengchongense]RPE77052.1 NlpC/P60 family protein [Vulcaniibacterium tengchongense]
MRLLLSAALALGLAAPCAVARDASPTLPIPPHGVIGIGPAQLDPAYWIGQVPDPDRELFSRADIAAHNAQLHRRDPAMIDIERLPPSLDRALVAERVGGLSKRPTRPLYDAEGRPIPARALDAIVANARLDAIPERQPLRYGLVVHRAALRTFPTHLRAFSTRGDSDIDRFQESALFPGDPVAIVHESADGEWWFVLSPRYAAWIEKRHVAEGSADAVFGYLRKSPYRVVTGGTVRTVFDPEEPGVSQLQLDMGVRVPVLADWPPDKPVHGQHPYASHVIELPVRDADGRLRFSPALLPRREDTQADYLSATPRHLIFQAFKFLGERYGWGHAYDARDCSGFVSEVYRSLGVELPRNTRDQAVSPVLDGVVFGENDGAARRRAEVARLRLGDLIYIPGHVMMVIGHVDGEPYVIHDTTGITYRGADGKPVRMTLNQVSVTPLLPLLYDGKTPTVERITAIRRLRGSPAVPAVPAHAAPARPASRQDL